MQSKQNDMQSSPNTGSFISHSNATSIEGRESELVALAYDAAEKRLREGTASSAEIVHFLKLGSTMGFYEKESIQADIELKKAKVEAIHQAETLDNLYKEAIDAMKRYSARSE